MSLSRDLYVQYRLRCAARCLQGQCVDENPCAPGYAGGRMIAFDAHHEKHSVSTQAGGTVFGFRLVHASAQPLVAVFVDAWCESETWLQRCECLASASAWCAHSMPTLMSPGLLEQHQLLSVSSERFRGFKEGYSVIRQTKSWVVGSGRPDARKLAISDFELTMTRVPISPAESFAAEAMLGTTRVSRETLIKTKQKRLRPRMARGK